METLIEFYYSNKNKVDEHLKKQVSIAEILKQKEDWYWQVIIQSLGTWGGASQWENLVADSKDFSSLSEEALLQKTNDEFENLFLVVFQKHSIRYANKKSSYLAYNFKLLQEMGGSETVGRFINQMKSKDAIISFNKLFKGISDKYARNMMMDVCHPLFNDTFAIDSRIRNLFPLLGIEKADYQQEEASLVEIAKELKLTCWELDRLLFHFYDELKNAHDSSITS